MTGACRGGDGGREEGLELRILGGVADSVALNLPTLSVLIQKTHEGLSFLRVLSPALDPELIHWAATELIITYSQAEDSLQLDLVSFTTRLLERTYARCYDVDKETQLPTYILLIKNKLLLTHYAICRGLDTDISPDPPLDIRLVCIDKSIGDLQSFCLRSRTCRVVYEISTPSNVADGAGFQCEACLELLSQADFRSEDPPLKTQAAKKAGLVKKCKGRRSRRTCPAGKTAKAGSSKAVSNTDCDTQVIQTSCSDSSRWLDGGGGVVKSEPISVEDIVDDDDDDWIVDDGDVVKNSETEDAEHIETKSAPRSRRKVKRWREKEDEAVAPEDGSRGVLQKRKRTSLIEFSARLRGEPRCQACAVVFESMLDYARHMKRNHSNGHRCPSCKKTFTFPELLGEHVAMHHVRVACDECGIVYSSKYGLLSHKNLRHSTENIEEPCYQCGKWLKKSSIAAHIRMVHEGEEQRTHLCNICGKSYKTKTDHDRHYTKHTGQKLYYCAVCGKGFRFWGGADDCKRRHEQNLRHVCTESGCGKGFNSRFRLQQHLRTHSGLKPFQCPLCSYDCSRRDNLRKHITGTHKYTQQQTDELEASHGGFSKKPLST